MLFLVLLVLMLGTICACVALALEISSLKSKVTPFNMEILSAVETQQQDLSDVVKEMNISLLQLQMDTSFDVQRLTQLLNITLYLQNTTFISASIQQLNTSLNDQYSALNDNFQQLNSSISSVNASFLVSFQQLLIPQGTAEEVAFL